MWTWVSLYWLLFFHFFWLFPHYSVTLWVRIEETTPFVDLKKQAHMYVSEHFFLIIISRSRKFVWYCTSGCVQMEIQTNSLLIIISEEEPAKERKNKLQHNSSARGRFRVRSEVGGGGFGGGWGWHACGLNMTTIDVHAVEKPLNTCAD